MQVGILVDKPSAPLKTFEGDHLAPNFLCAIDLILLHKPVINISHNSSNTDESKSDISVHQFTCFSAS